MIKDNRLGLLAVLEDGAVRLEPLDERHREPLRLACGEDHDIWAMYATSYDASHFDDSFTRLLANPRRLQLAALVQRQVAGLTCWISPD